MIEVARTVRDNVHQLFDTLPEERRAGVLGYPAELQDGEDPLNAEAEAAIEGLEDLSHGRTVTLEECGRNAPRVRYRVRR